jgi:hypothetical protein
MSSNNARNHIFILFKMHIAHCHSRITGFELKSEIEAFNISTSGQTQK